MSRTSFVLAAAANTSNTRFRSATALRRDEPCVCCAAITARSHESLFAHSAAALRHACETQALAPSARPEIQRSTVTDLGIALRHQKHRQRRQVFASFVRGTEHSQRIRASRFFASAREVLARVSRPSFQSLFSNTAFYQQARFEQRWLRHVRCSPYLSHASVKPVVIGTACQHDVGRTFSGFGESECRAQRVQASTSRRLAEHSAMRVEQGGLWLRHAIKGIVMLRQTTKCNHANKRTV
jgi:hypothetical protein